MSADKNELRRTGLYALEPDEFALRTATYVMFKPCPFCGADAGPVLDYCNDTPLFGDKPLYRSVVACKNDRCTAQTSANDYTRDAARTQAIERWEDRRPASERPKEKR